MGLPLPPHLPLPPAPHNVPRSGSLDAGSRSVGERRRVRRRPTLELEEEGEYSMPPSSTLYDDAAGLKLFLDILNGPDGQNREAEAELRKLIDRRRNRMSEEGGEGRRRRVEEEEEVEEAGEKGRSRKMKLASRRRRRHQAQSQGEGGVQGEVVLDERRLEGERGDKGRRREEDGEGGGRRREKRGGRKTRPEPLVPGEGEGGEEPTHIATTHEDTTSGAVHCFRDEYGTAPTPIAQLTQGCLHETYKLEAHNLIGVCENAG